MNRREFARSAALMAIAPQWAKALAASEGKRIRFSFMLWALEKQAPFDRCLEIVSEAGYQGVELVGEFQRWSPQERSTTLARIRSLGLMVDSMSGVKAGFAVPEETPVFKTQFAAHLNYAKELGCPQVILLSGHRVASVGDARQREISIENLRWAADEAAKERIEIVIEPIDRLENPTIFLATVTDGFEMVRSVGAPNLKVLYDFYHEQRGYGNLIEKLEKNIDLVGLVHVADVPGRHEPGTGEIDYGNIYRKLAELHYDRFIAMEYYPTKDPVVSLRESRVEAQRALAAG